MLENIEVINHSCIKIKKEKIIYIDPFKVLEESNDADFIFITHNHYDHYSEEDIKKVLNKDTKIIVTYDIKESVEKYIPHDNIICVKPGEEYNLQDLSFKTIPAYNINKQFHSKNNNWVGYIIKLSDVKYYIAGDTDITEENKNVKCDVAFVPVGGTYTMTAKEAAMLINIIKPKFAVPIHYGSIVGTYQDAVEFINLLDNEINGIILNKFVDKKSNNIWSRKTESLYGKVKK